MQKFEFMRYLSLSNNQLTGKINSTSFVPNCQLHSLYLKNNSLVGELPVSLRYCNRLSVLDVGYNMLSGPIPRWIGANFTDLSIFILRSNQFSGTIPSNLCWLRKLRVLDLSCNNTSGSAIKCLSNSTALTTRENLQDTSDAGQYFGVAYPISDITQSPNLYDLNRVDGVLLLWQGIEREYTSILRFMKTVDFSSNFLQGQIPEEFGSLVGLISLNMSNNNLSGHIPQTIGEMGMLQVLDLSTNQLSGEIPQSISSLSSLSYLDLSDNNLTGQIPIGTQVQTRNASSFSGNIGLCGLPLPKKCLPAEAPAPEVSSHKDEDEDEIISNGFYISMGVGFVIGLWGVLGCLLFKNAWSSAYFRFLKSATDWLYVRSHIMNARLRRRAL